MTDSTPLVNPSGLAATKAFVLSRANHTGSQLSSTISDLPEFIRDTIGATLRVTAPLSLTVDDTNDTITFGSSATGGGSSVTPASNAETVAGTNTVDYVTPAGLAYALTPAYRAISAATYTLAATDANNALLGFTAACTVTVPTNALVPLGVGTSFILENNGPGPLTVAPASAAVTITGTLTTSVLNAQIILVQTATNVWAATVVGGASTTIPSMIAMNLGQTVSPAGFTATQVPLTETTADTLGTRFTAVTNGVKVNSAGTAVVNVVGWWNDSNSGGRSLMIYVNGNKIREVASTVGGGTRPTYSERIKVAANDVITFFIYAQVSGATMVGFGDYATFLKVTD